MFKKLLLALLGLTLTTAVGASPAGTTTWLTSLDEALARAAEHDRYVLVDLYAEWCGWCKTLEEKVFSTPEFRAATRDFVLLRVDVEDGAEGSALQARFGAYSLPTILVMDENRVKVGAVVGFSPTADFLQKLGAEIASYQTFLAYYETVRGNSRSGSGDLGALYQLGEQLQSRGDGARAAEVYKDILQRTGETSPKAPWLHYLIADSYRLGGRFGDALEALDRARELSGGAESRELLERVDLLSFHIAQDSRDCEKAKSLLELFLEKHPMSAMRRGAENQLRQLRRGEGMGCA